MRVLAAYGLGPGISDNKNDKARNTINNRTWHSLERELGHCVPPVAPELAHPWASAVAWAASGVGRGTGENQELFLGV